ncbi:MAG: MFS transporter [Thermoplasmatales archaeon]
MDSRYVLFFTRAFRGYIYGAYSVITLILLIDSGINPIIAGLVVTGSIATSSLLTFYISTRYGAGYSKSFLTIFSALLILGLAGIYLSSNPFIKALSVIIGSLGVNPSDNTLFSSFEQPIISRIKEDQNSRNRLFSAYSFSGYLASSFGAITLRLGINNVVIISIILALFILVLYAFLPHIEGKGKIFSAPVSRKSRVIARDVSVLFSIDAIGGGFVLQSLMAYWFKVRYGFNIGELGYMFTIVDIITALSVLFTPLISSRIGLINTMVFTHIPSNVFLALISIVPNLYASLIFLFLRQSLSQMDVPTRQSYLNSVVDKEDRSYVTGTSNASRNLSNGATPYISSYLISIGAGSASFISGGIIKILYDLLIFFRFRSEREKY